MKRLVIGLAVLLIASVVAAAWWHYSRLESTKSEQYGGSEKCATCHAQQTAAWRESQHAMAMAAASDRTVLGRFDGGQFTYAGVTSTFFRRDGRFYVRTDGADGSLADFEIKYTFGVAPLQQYLVELAGGRLQALGLAWDTRPGPAGGQRWFHLYPEEAIRAGDPLHWTGLQQNWNFMCADCHSTNLRMGYDQPSRQFRTTWSEISVGCEACHGPVGSGLESTASSHTLTPARLDERQAVQWRIDPVSQQPVRSKPRESDREIEVCARCHSRRSQLTDLIKPGDPLEDGFRPAVLEPGLFHADGQQNEEVYTYASFLQSKMYAKGVTCSDCHDPHSGKTRVTGNALCTQCHTAARYDVQAHHFHRPNTAAAACSTCHMPVKTYMVIDPRHDHSFRVPRPDLSAAIGVPDVCTRSCHRDRKPAWAAGEVRRRTGRAASGYQQFAEAFSSADRGAPGSGDALRRLAADAAQPAIVRASALERMARSGGPIDDVVAGVALKDRNPIVRRAALDALQHAEPATRVQLATPLLSDGIRTVRIQAAVCLADLADGQLSGQARAAFDRAFEEFLAEQRHNGSRPEAQTNLGTVLLARGQGDSALAAFNEAIALDRTFVPAYINLADVYRAQGNDSAAERTLRGAIQMNRASAEAHHALGLTLVRQRRLQEALQELAEAARLDTGPRSAYVYAVALHDSGDASQARKVLAASLVAHPFDRDTLLALVNFSEEAGRLTDARQYAARLLALEPQDPEIRALAERLKGPGR